MSAADRRRWDARWRERAQEEPAAPEPFLVRETPALPRGRVLDVAAGPGRNSLWLAAQGFAVTAIDVSPVAMAQLARTASERGLTVETRTADLDDPAALADLDPFDALVVIRFRPTPAQWATLLRSLRPSGRLLLCSFGPEQHRRHGFPLAYCLDRAALEAELAPGLQLLRWESFGENGAFLEGSWWTKQAAGEA